MVPGGGRFSTTAQTVTKQSKSNQLVTDIGITEAGRQYLGSTTTDYNLSKSRWLFNEVNDVTASLSSLDV